MKMLMVVVLVPIVASALAAQDTTRVVSDSLSPVETRLYRDPHRARMLGSLIPGAGHVYAGEYWRGFADGVGAVAAIGLGAVVYNRHQEPFCIISPCPRASQTPHRLAGAAAIGSGIWSWIRDARDAPHAAERANAKQRAKSVAITPFVESASRSRAVDSGLAISW